MLLTVIGGFYNAERPVPIILAGDFFLSFAADFFIKAGVVLSNFKLCFLYHSVLALVPTAGAVSQSMSWAGGPRPRFCRVLDYGSRVTAYRAVRY